MIEWLQNHQFPCAIKSIFGIDCPVCGAQRATIFLLQGNFAASFKMYPPLLFIFLLITLSLTHQFFPKLIKRKFLINYAVFVLIIIGLNYTIKIVTGNLS